MTATKTHTRIPKSPAVRGWQAWVQVRPGWVRGRAEAGEHRGNRKKRGRVREVGRVLRVVPGCRRDKWGIWRGDSTHTHLPWTLRWHRRRSCFPEREECGCSVTVHTSHTPTPFWASLREEAGSHRLETHVQDEGAEVMLSFGQHTEGAHNVTFCMFQQLKAQVCGGRTAKVRVATARDLWPAPSRPLWLPNLPHPTRTGVLEVLHIPVIFEVVEQAASREKTKTKTETKTKTKTGCVGLARVDVAMSWPVSAGAPHSPGAKSELWYSRIWIVRVEGNGKGEAGLIVVSTKETLSVSRVIDQVVSVRGQWRQSISMVWTSNGTRGLPRAVLGWGGPVCPSPPSFLVDPGVLTAGGIAALDSSRHQTLYSFPAIKDISGNVADKTSLAINTPNVDRSPSPCRALLSWACQCQWWLVGVNPDHPGERKRKLAV